MQPCEPSRVNAVDRSVRWPVGVHLASSRRAECGRWWLHPSPRSQLFLPVFAASSLIFFTPRTRHRFPLDDLYDLDHVTGWDPYNPHDVPPGNMI